MITLPNIISFLRIPLAFLFLKQNVMVRTVAIILAMLSDGLDGFLARRFQLTSRFGTLLDPLTDRFFVLFIVALFLYEDKLTGWEVGALVSRDVALLLFGLYLIIQGKFKKFEFRAIFCGKATTFLQFVNLLALSLDLPIPTYFYAVYFMLGVLAFAELYLFTADESGTFRNV